MNSPITTYDPRALYNIATRMFLKEDTNLDFYKWIKQFKANGGKGAHGFLYFESDEDALAFKMKYGNQ